MPWLAATAAIGAGAGLATSLINKPGKTSVPSAPDFFSDPLVGQSDTSLFNFGSDLLKGILPSSYQDLIQTNSPQFQRMMSNSNAAIQGAGESEAAVQGNARSGAANESITKAIASNTANLSYSDLLNTQLNQKALLGTGLDSINYAGTMALSNQGQQNQFNASNYASQLGYGANMAGVGQRAAQYAGSSMGAGLSGAGAGIGSILGMLGSSGGGGTSDLTSMLADNSYLMQL